MALHYVYRSRMLRWFAPRWVNAMTLYPYLLFRVERNQVAFKTFKHELTHVAQIERMGVLKFYARYLWYTIKYGYRDNPLEIEARKASEEAPSD